MSRDLDDLDFDLDDEELPLVEIEFDEEDEKSHKTGTVLKVLLIVLVVCALLAAGFFVVKYVLEQQSPIIDITSIVTPEPTGWPSGPSSAPELTPETPHPDANVPEADQPQTEDHVTDEETAETTIAPPPPAPTPTAIPEQYVIPGIDPGDLTAVRDYIQSELNAMAADVNYPNVDEYTVNDDCTVFTAVCTSLNESTAERGATEKIYEFGRMYAAYAGTTVDNIHIDYRNHMGDLLWTRDSNK